MSTISLFTAFAVLSATVSAQDLPASFGPPPDSDPLTWGFYATHEVKEPTDLVIEGTIPEWLTGSLYRGAAATWDVGNYTAEHWFDGFTRNHRFEIANGSVSYRSRNGSDELAHFVEETGLYPGGSFGGDPCKIIFGAFETTFRDGNNARGDKDSDAVLVSFVRNWPGLGESCEEESCPLRNLVTTTDGNRLQQIDPVTLEPIEIFTNRASNELLVNEGRSAAHPALSADGSIYNYILDMSLEEPVYRVFGLYPPEGESRILANITDAPPAYIHSMFHTEKHLILIVWQADLVQEAGNIVDSIGPWDPERKCLFYVIDPVMGGVISKYESEETFFGFHQINAFENESGDIFIDLPLMKDHSLLEAVKMENLRANVGVNTNGSSKNDLQGVFTRFRLPHHANVTGASTTLRAEVDFELSHINLELPRINEAFAGKPYRYTWGVHSEKPGYFSDSIIKIDTHTKETKLWMPCKNHLPSEPVFISRPGAVDEDDGVVLTVALDSSERLSSLVVIDAVTMREIGRARMPIVMGYGFHGTWGQM